MYESQRTFKAYLDDGAADIDPNRPAQRGYEPTVVVVFRSDQLTDSGAVVDEGDLVGLGTYLTDGIGAEVREVFSLPLTEERLARHFFGWCMAHLPRSLPDRLAEIRVSQTPYTNAVYRESES